MFVGKTIKRLRIARGFTQEILSSFAGIARSHLAMIENDSKQPNFDTICKLAYAFDMPPHMLVEEIEKDNQVASDDPT